MGNVKELRVAQDGRAQFRTVQAAIDSIPLGNTKRTIIRIAPGMYRQPVYVPKTKNYISLQVGQVLKFYNPINGVYFCTCLFVCVYVCICVFWFEFSCLYMWCFLHLGNLGKVKG